MMSPTERPLPAVAQPAVALPAVAQPAVAQRPAADVIAAPALVVRKATIGYRGRPVVIDADLTVEVGEVVALLGANGSGKTTLVRGLVGLAELLNGHIEVAGRPVSARLGRNSVRIGYVPQRLSPPAGIPTTAMEVVSTGLLARRTLWAAGGSAKARVRAALAEIGLAGFAGTPVFELSGGQQRRVLIARALVADPGIVILDEPTAGVDRAGVMSLVATLADLKAAGRTLVVVTHEIDVFGGVVDRTVTMVDGHLMPGAPRQGDVAGSH